ncbi:hypothetical protein DFH08DRAFT_984871 [Mycena albidolilacea]|uniref:Uncharacterized protein n=1 Tax=Mycena albidolilacea TaxID=1033008 RepID=A0AAD7ABM3_9AGAR|nr:hypothetical protein DFH08DRAFT_984871 [Mycena albidolilacea]
MPADDSGVGVRHPVLSAPAGEFNTPSRHARASSPAHAAAIIDDVGNAHISTPPLSQPPARTTFGFLCAGPAEAIQPTIATSPCVDHSFHDTSKTGSPSSTQLPYLLFTSQRTFNRLTATSATTVELCLPGASRRIIPPSPDTHVSPLHANIKILRSWKSSPPNAGFAAPYDRPPQDLFVSRRVPSKLRVSPLRGTSRAGCILNFKGCLSGTPALLSADFPENPPRTPTLVPQPPPEMAWGHPFSCSRQQISLFLPLSVALLTLYVDDKAVALLPPPQMLNNGDGDPG